MAEGGYSGGSSVVGWGSGSWVGRGSVTSQSSAKPKGGSSQSKSKQNVSSSTKPKAKKRKIVSANESAKLSHKGNGLTIPEMVAKAHKRVVTVEREIASTRRLLSELELSMQAAKRELVAAQNMPRRSAVGVAMSTAVKPSGET